MPPFLIVSTFNPAVCLKCLIIILNQFNTSNFLLISLVLLFLRNPPDDWLFLMRVGNFYVL